MHSITFLSRTVVWLLIAIAVSLILYVFIGTDGQIWTAQALRTAQIAGFVINLLAFVIIAIAKKKWALWLNFYFLILMLACGVFGVLSAFPGTGGRYGNHWLDISAKIGLINYVIVSLTLKKQWTIAYAALAGMFPAVMLYMQFALIDPLKKEFASIDEQSTCFYRMDQVEWNKAAFERIFSMSDLNLGFFIGEHSPRVVKIQGDKAFLWRYGSQEFSTSFRGVYFLSPQPSELTKHCRTGSE